MAQRDSKFANKALRWDYELSKKLGSVDEGKSSSQLYVEDIVRFISKEAMFINSPQGQSMEYLPYTEVEFSTYGGEINNMGGEITLPDEWAGRFIEITASIAKVEWGLDSENDGVNKRLSILVGRGFEDILVGASAMHEAVGTSVGVDPMTCVSKIFLAEKGDRVSARFKSTHAVEKGYGGALSYIQIRAFKTVEK